MINEFEKQLSTHIEIQNSTVKEAMNYSLLAGGKRIRPLMMLALVQDLMGDVSLALKPAIALEMIHTYSLVHDDLPSMDNDDYRRHKLTNHKVYGEAMAILAGDALLNDAFMSVVQSDLKPALIVDLLEVLGRNAGPDGMILGQEVDIKNDFNTLDELATAYQLKTGCLFAAALESAVLLADRKELQADARQLGYDLGIFFQYQDDLLEYTSDFEKMGKNVSSDQDEDKKTIVTFLGVEKAQEHTNALFQTIIKDLKAMTQETTLYDLVVQMEQRQH